MSKLEIIEAQLKQLNTDELRSFRQWFAEFDAEAWDRQFESDAQSGRLDKLAEQALRDYESGKTTDL